MSTVSYTHLDVYKRQLQTGRIESIVGDTPCFYHSRIIKKLDGDSMNKTGLTRMTGLLLKRGIGFAVYNLSLIHI